MDDEIECVDCGTEFTITEGEKEFYESKGFPLPKRCKYCRKKRKFNNNSRRKEV